LKKIALHGRAIEEKSVGVVEKLVDFLLNENFEVSATRQLLDLNPNISFPTSVKNESEIVPDDFDAFFSLGGDGTFLETVTLVDRTEIPILGINTGRLGFLATIARDQIEAAVKKLVAGDYYVEKRSLVSVNTQSEIFKGKNYALNECTILRKETSSMIVINAYLDDNYLTTYWADGIMVATPTGSTGYSLSCGGPIILPTTSNFIITPVSPHNLNIRPFIVPDTSRMKFEVQSKDVDFLISLDSRSATISGKTQIIIEKADFHANLIKIEGDLFVDTLRNKLSWGYDKRN